MTAESRALLWAAAAIVLWGTLAAVVGDALTGVRAPSLVFWTFVFAAPTLVAWEVRRGTPVRALAVAPPPIVLLGLWGIFGYHAAFFEALDRAPIVEANLLNYLWPLLMVLLSPLLAREPVSWPAIGGAAVGFAGAALVVTQGRTLAVRPEHAGGYLLAALAALSWSSFSVLLKRAGPAAQGKMATFAMWSLAAAAAGAALRGGLAPPPPRALAAAAWVGIGPMALAFVCWDRAMATGRASRIGALSYLDPLLSTLCVAAFLGRSISAASWTGMALIVAGAAAPSLWKLRPSAAGPPSPADG